MSRPRVESFAVSLDGYAAGPHRSLENPLGLDRTNLHQWFFPTATFQQMIGQPGRRRGSHVAVRNYQQALEL